MHHAAPLTLGLFVPVLLFAGAIAAETEGQINPDDPQASFEFAREAAQAGDYQGAIAALENILQQNPALSNIRLELGVLYQRVGNDELARRYINQALQDPKMPEHVRERAQALLEGRAGDKGLPPFAGALFISALYDSNANAGASTDTIVLDGIRQQLSKDALSEDDASLEVIGALRYNQALGDRGGDNLEANLLSYNRYYNDLTDLDINVLDADVGPRFNMGNDARSPRSVRPYAGVNTTYLGHDKYKDGAALGVNYRAVLPRNTLAEVDAKIENQSYANSDSRPQAELRSGTLTQLKGQVTQRLTPQVQVYGKLGTARRDSDADFESYDEVSAGVGVRYEHQRRKQQALPTTTTLSLDWQGINYDEADTLAGFDKARQEERVTTRLSNNLPVNENTAFNSALSYTNNQSDTVLYDYDNWAASVGVSFTTY